MSTICRPKISPPKVIYKVQSMPYKSLPLGAFWTSFGRIFPTGVLELLYPYQPANPLVESMFKALIKTKNKIKQIELHLGDGAYTTGYSRIWLEFGLHLGFSSSGVSRQDV